MTSDDDRPADQHVRDCALEPTRSFIVQAPAGSGKTELLTQRFLRLLATVDSPEEILAVTFTRKAAAEMRDRVLDALELARMEDPPQDPHLSSSWRLGREVLRVDRERDWQLLDAPSRLRILTLDALNQSLARRLPVTSGVGAPLAIAADPQSLYAEVVLRVVERLSGSDAESHAVARLVTHLDNDLAAFESLFGELLARREHWLDLGILTLDPASLRVVLERALADAAEDEVAAMRALVSASEAKLLVAIATAAARQLDAEGQDSPVLACAAMTTLPGSSAEDLRAWRGLGTLLLTAAGRLRRPRGINGTIGCAGSTPHRTRLIELLTVLAQRPGFAERLHAVRRLPPTRYTDAQWALLEALLTVLRVALAELDLVCAGRAEGDYPAVAIAARRALGAPDAPTDLALRLDYRLRHILVDEFQDTSRAQVELLKSLTAGWTPGDGRTLFLVGDPMQSIYRFREADVAHFLRIRRDGLGDVALEPLALTVNFRSHRPVVDWVNAAFQEVMAPFDDPATGAVAYTASTPRADAATDGAVVVHGLSEPKQTARRTEAAAVVRIVQESRTRHPDASIAVLVTSRSHLALILMQLRVAGLPVRAVEIDPLASRPVVVDLIALTRALVHLADRTAWLAVLRSPCCGLDLEALHALVADAPERTVPDLMFDVTRRARLAAIDQRRLARPAAVLERALAERGRHRLREWVERTWHALGGPATLDSPAAMADADVFFGRLEEIERCGDLEDVARLEALLGALFGSAAPDPAAIAVDVMTVHKAKGLEFDVVIVPGLDRAMRGDEDSLLRWSEHQRSEDRSSLLVGLMGARGAPPDAIHAWLKHLEQQRARNERQRLLYVAATRAVRELHLIGNVEPRRRDGVAMSGRPSAGSLLGLLWPHVAGDFAAATGAMRSDVAAPDAAPGNRDVLRRLPLDWAAPPAEPPAVTGAAHSIIEDEALRPEFDWVSETSRHAGTVVHREIERFIRGSAAGGEDTMAARRRYLAELAELGVPPSHREEAAERVVRAIANMLDDERGRWLLAGAELHESSEAELALTGYLGDELVNGVIDRTFVDATGTRWLVDIKTSSHGGGGLEAFLASEERRYRPQLERYVRLVRAWRPEEPVRAALYFPLLRAWREVSVG